MLPRVPTASFGWVPIVLLAFASVATAGPETYRVRLDTTRGPIVIECHRSWAPLGADRFYDLVVGGYYDDVAVFRVRPKTWVQFGINGEPKVAQAWRSRTIPDDPFQSSHGSERGTIFFAWAVANGRTTQVVINLKDNREAHDKEPFVPFGRVVEGMDVADRLFDGYGEAAGGGIRAGKQDPVFQGGNDYLKKNFPELDYIKTARVVP